MGMATTDVVFSNRALAARYIRVSLTVKRVAFKRHGDQDWADVPIEGFETVPENPYFEVRNSAFELEATRQDGTVDTVYIRWDPEKDQYNANMAGRSAFVCGGVDPLEVAAAVLELADEPPDAGARGRV